jgi:hypothetical protein
VQQSLESEHLRKSLEHEHLTKSLAHGHLKKSLEHGHQKKSRKGFLASRVGLPQSAVQGLSNDLTAAQELS